MAHIATCIANFEPGSIPKSSSPTPLMLSTTPPPSSIEKPFPWRMLPTEQRKYQLFPKDKQLPSLNINKSLDPEAAFAVAMSERNDKQPPGSTLRLRVNQNNPARRRKISVPELEPMTTVQEIAMDSPTIPGRPPLHERSASAPEDTRDERRRGSTFLRDLMLPLGDEFAQSIDEALTTVVLPTPAPQSLSRRLAPLVIPQNELPAPLLQSKVSSAKLRSGSTPPSTSARNGRMDSSPHGRSRVNPSSSTPDLSYPVSATIDGCSSAFLPTPISAPIMEPHRTTPRPWEGSSMYSGHNDRAMPPFSQAGQSKSHTHLHRRGASESSTSIMDRGRSRKPVELRNNNSSNNNNGSAPKLNETTRRAMSCERRAFEELPKGWKPSEAMNKLNADDAMALQKQALGQAERFEVLRVEDVEALSKELRQLDERTDYLRRTHTSLRAGRRNLHSRICQYLRSPRVAKFSHDSMLKQEEALAELDASIDDWVTKLELAENRRTRVRQKLLEHVAAATLLAVSDSTGSSRPQSPETVKSPGGPQELSTPPRSPSKTAFASRAGSASPSPQRVVAQVPSTIFEQPVIEDAAENGSTISRSGSTNTLRRSDVESIRIYAGDDIYTLLADVENQISQMGAGSAPAPTPEARSARDIQHQRQRSHDLLSGLAGVTSATSASPTASSSTTINGTPSGSTPTVSPSTKMTGSNGLASTRVVAAAINRDDRTATPSPVTSHATDAAKERAILLTAAVFKP